MVKLTHRFATRAGLIREAVDSHREWIESRLGVRLPEAVFLQVETSFAKAAIPFLIGYVDPDAPVSKPIRDLTGRVQALEIPPGCTPLIELTQGRAVESDGCDNNGGRAYKIDWVDLPILFRIRGLDFPIVAVSVSIHLPDDPIETAEHVLIARRESIEQIISLQKALSDDDGAPKLKVAHEDAQEVAPCAWEDLVLDPTVIALLKGDFDSFFERKAWFRSMRLPFRRGYLLHGPPGCGKSSAVRCMLTSRGLTAYTLRLFDSRVEERDLDATFERARRNTPSMILLEDLDRAFPRGAEPRSKISLQALLNSLDGVGSGSGGNGIITVATANNPSVLDASVLRRPGRFDRSILFSNPTPELRRAYFVKMHSAFAEVRLDDAIKESEGFSYALLRESWVLAAQSSFERNDEVTVEDLLHAVRSLRRTLQLASLRRNVPGFSVVTTSAPRVSGGDPDRRRNRR